MNVCLKYAYKIKKYISNDPYHITLLLHLFISFGIILIGLCSMVSSKLQYPQLYMTLLSYPTIMMVVLTLFIGRKNIYKIVASVILIMDIALLLLLIGWLYCPHNKLNTFKVVI